MKKTLISISSIVSLGLPVLALASSGVQLGYVNSIFTEGSVLLRNIIIFLFGLAVVWFIWNVIRYSMSDSDEGREKAKSQMIWGIIAIAVIVSVWGIVALLREVFGVGSYGSSAFDGQINNMIPSVGGNKADYNAKFDRLNNQYLNTDLSID
jgi:uncharacterized membrane protein YidH (DUF202 family)